jgi:hypothetical protein
MQYLWNIKYLSQPRHTHLEPSSSFENSPHLIMHFNWIVVILFALALVSTHSKASKNGIWHQSFMTETWMLIHWWLSIIVFICTYIKEINFVHNIFNVTKYDIMHCFNHSPSIIIHPMSFRIVFYFQNAKQFLINWNSNIRWLWLKRWKIVTN